MKNHRFILEPYKSLKSRFICPNCQKREKTFSLYIDNNKGEHIATNVGRCNRETQCGYHYTPKQYFEDNNINFENKDFVPHSRTFVIPKKKNTSYIDAEIFKQSLQGYKKNNFIQFLINRFGNEATTKAIEKYFIGTSKHWNGATIFWQIDSKGRIRTGKIMLYDAGIGKRIKKPFNHIHWVHSLLKIDNYELEQCFFGEHLLKDKIKPIAIVESEKSAIICSVFLPNFIWLAVGSLTNLNKSKCEVLNGRNVVLFPDLNGFDKWSVKANEFGFKISDLLETKATEEQKKDGLDIADFLLSYENVKTESEQIKQELITIKQKRKIQKLELSKEESYKAIQYFIDNNTDTYRIVNNN